MKLTYLTRQELTKFNTRIKKLSDWYTYTMISIRYSGKYKPEYKYEAGVFAISILKEVQNGLF